MKQSVTRALTLATLFVAVGCTNVKHLYEGPERPAAEVARVWTPQLIIEKFDGRSMLNIGTVFYVPAGRHSFGVQRTNVVGTLRTRTDFTVSPTLDAGKTYYIYFLSEPKPMVGVRELDAAMQIPSPPLMFDDTAYDELVETSKTKGTQVPIH